MPFSERIQFANRLRGLAALCVVVYHYSIFWVLGLPAGAWANLPQIYPAPNWPMQWMFQFPVQLPPPWVPTIDWGAFGVALFFLISGFVISNSMKRYSAQEFLVHRLLRIYPTYAVGFAFVVGVLALSGTLYDRGFPYSAGQVLAHIFPGVREVIGSIYIDPVIWTLEIEIKFYGIVFLAMLFADRQSPPTMMIAATLGTCGVVAAWLRPEFIVSSPQLYKLLADAQFLVFIFIGAIFFELWCKKISSRRAVLKIAVLGALFSLIWILLFQGNPVAVQWLGRIWSYAAAIAVFAAAMRWSHWFEGRSRVADFFANISYPLYVLHLAPGFLIMMLLKSTGLWPPVIVALALAAVSFFALVLHRILELPAQRLARRFKAPDRALNCAPTAAVTAGSTSFSSAP
ncbi:acyltransferase family protein [Bradyrhizobium cenepequi]